MKRNVKEQQRAELHKMIWQVANDLRGSIDGWDFKSYVLGMLFYRFISDNLSNYINKGEHEAGNPDFNYAILADDEAEFAREEIVNEKGIFILPSELFENARQRAPQDENLNKTLEAVFRDIEGSAVGTNSEDDLKGLFDDLNVNGETLRLRNILTSFDEFANDEILSDRDKQDYQSTYLDLYNERKRAEASDKESIIEDVVFEIELIKQVEINVDYILLLVQKYRAERGDGDDIELRAGISRAVDSSPSLRNKKDLIENFVDSISVDGSIEDEWHAYVAEQQEKELHQIIATENLKPEATEKFVEDSFRNGALRTSGAAITKVLPRVSRFSKDKKHSEKKNRVIQKLGTFFERFFGLVDTRGKR